MNVLITNNTLTGVSAPFDVEGQLTVFAFGLTPEQRVSFWIVKLSDPLRDQCGCPPYAPRMPSIEEELPYECCNTQVILTADRPWVIIDSPQGAKIIAKLEALVDDEWVAVAPPSGQYVYWLTTHTPDVTDCMRGCRCEDDVWIATGLTTCDIDADMVRIEEISNCGTKRWTDQGPIVWTPTGQTFCVSDDLGEGEGACSLADFGFDQPGYYIETVNVCGQTRWQFACTLTWQPTGNFRCEGEVLVIEERSTVCGLVRWNAETGQSVTWTATGNTRCTNLGFEREERNNCGTTRWVYNAPLNWQPTGNYDCRSNVNFREEVNQCGVTRWINTGVACGTSGHTMTYLTPQAANVVEGQTACWNFGLNSPVIGSPLTIDFALSGADQTRNAYVTPRSVTLAVGATTGQLCIATTDDIVVDGTEQLCVTPQLSARLTNAPAVSCINVLDNDSAGSSHTVTWGVAPAAVEEGEEICWDIVLDGPVSGSPLNLVFGWSGTDDVRNNYPNVTVSIPVGDSSATLCIFTTDDTDIDGTEQLCPVLLPNGRVTVGPGTQCVDVTDNDVGASVHEVTCVQPPVDAVEGTLFCWDFELDAPVSGTPLTVTSTLTGSEQAVHGYVAPSVVVPIGASSGTLCVQTTDDAIVEGLKQLCLTINTSSRITAVNDVDCDTGGGQASIVFTNVVGIGQTINEGEVLNVRVSLSAPAPVGGVSGTIVFSGSEKLAYPGAYGDIAWTVAAGNTHQDYLVTIYDDFVDDGNTALYGTLSVSTPDWTIGIEVAGASVLDNDGAVEPGAPGGGGGGGGCYMSGTMIRTPTGYVPINSLLTGDEVLAFSLPGMPTDHEGGWDAWQTLSLKGLSYLATLVRSNLPFTEKGGYRINRGPVVTGEHPYFVFDGQHYQFIKASQVHTGHKLVTATGLVQVTTALLVEGPFTFFHLDVEAPDTLIAQTVYGDVFAHNKICDDCPDDEPGDAPPDTGGGGSPIPTPPLGGG